MKPKEFKIIRVQGQFKNPNAFRMRICEYCKHLMFMHNEDGNMDCQEIGCSCGFI